MPTVGTSTARGQKRKRSPEVEPPSESTPPPEPPWKRAGFRSAEEANTAFWDNLSRVPLCPPALRELDRRNWLSIGSAAKSIARSAGPTTRSATRRTALVNVLGPQKSTVLEDRAAQLKRFARRGGPDLHDLRGVWMPKTTPSVMLMTSSQYPEPSEASPTMPPRKTPYRTPSDSSQSTSQTGGRTSTYNPAFEQNLIKHGVYPNGYRQPDGHRAPKPDNWQEIQYTLAQPRPSLSPSRFSEGAFEVFVDKTTEALGEPEVMANAFPIMREESNIPSATQRLFGNLAPLTDGTIVDAKPDFSYGARPEQLDPRVREELGSYVVPSTNQSAPILPNNSTEGKGPGGTWAVADRQTCYAGALGARAMLHLQSYGQPEPVYDNNAYTVTSTFDGRHLHMYTTHPTAPTKPGGRPKYHMNQCEAFAMTRNVETFRQGATAYRNARDWAKEKRDEFIDAANETVADPLQDISIESSGYSEPSTSTNRVTVLESDTSADELTLNDEVIIHRSGKRPRRGEPERDRRKYRSDKRGGYTW